MYGLQNTYVSGGWGEGGGSSLAWTEDDEKTVSFAMFDMSFVIIL